VAGIEHLKMDSNIKTYSELLELIDQQEQIIIKQKEIITRLVNENVEQENMINELLKGYLDE